MHRTGGGPQRPPMVVVHRYVPLAARSVRRMRRDLRDDLTDSGLPPACVADAEIVVSELLSNAVRHARPLVEDLVLVGWRVRAGVVEVHVTDGGAPQRVSRQDPACLSTGGRGLNIVAALARAWGVVDLRGGRSTVWAALVPEQSSLRAVG